MSQNFKEHFLYFINNFMSSHFVKVKKNKNVYARKYVREEQTCSRRRFAFQKIQNIRKENVVVGQSLSLWSHFFILFDFDLFPLSDVWKCPEPGRDPYLGEGGSRRHGYRQGCGSDWSWSGSHLWEKPDPDPILKKTRIRPNFA